MAPLIVEPYTEAEDERWDHFVEQAFASTFLHTRRFLSYHGDRFCDRSVLVFSGGELVGVLAAAEDPRQATRVVSHPGVTYGGLVHSGKLAGESTVEALEAIAVHYATLGYNTLRYKALPHIYHSVPAGDDLYALFRLGATRYRCDLSSAIDLALPLALSQRRRRALKKAQGAGLSLVGGPEIVPALWEVLTENLARKHGTRPVHSAAEILALHTRFPGALRFVAASWGERVVAGVVLFNSCRVAHAQYIASSEEGYAINALDAVFAHAITEAQAEGRRFFDFGISNEDEGRVLNTGLHRFKSEFGAGGVVHEFYDLPCAPGTRAADHQAGLEKP